MIVIDASIALSWCFHDERTPYTQQLLARVIQQGASVPQLWHLEVSNAMLIGLIKGRINESDLLLQLQYLNELPVSVDLDTANAAFAQIYQIARSDRLTTYDAAYVELALRSGLPLATLDKAMRKAATKHGVQVISE